MALINQAIANLYNGVSQQPASLRHTSQAELQENAFPSIATGLRKRNPTFHIAKLSNIAPATGAYIHMMNRDVNERYIAVIANGDLSVYDLAGNKKTVNFPEGKAYLNAPDAVKDFAMVTVADYSFVVNKTINCAMASTVSAVNPVNVGYLSVVASPAKHVFTVTVGSYTKSYTMPDAGGTLANLTESIRSAFITDTAFAAEYDCVTSNNSIVKFTRKSGAAISLSATDTYGNQGMYVLNSGVAQVTNLPVKFDDTTYVVKVNGAPGTGAAGYYVKFNGVSWQETVKPGSKNILNASTLPFKLVRNADGTFTFQSLTWDTRLVGDDETNPPPSFVGRPIRDMFFFRNRLGVLADENVSLSRAGSFFNFWGETALSVLDSDPVDTSTSSTKVSVLNFAVPFNKDLVLFSDQSQFQLTAGDVLTPKTVKVDSATEFDSSTICRPVAVGQSLYFPVEKENYTSIREYFVDATTITNDATDVTAHVPTYLPRGVFKMASSSAEDVVVALSSKAPDSLFLYKFYWSKAEKVQSAWSRFVFEPSDRVLSVAFLGSVLYLVIGRNDGLYLEKMSLMPYEEDAGLGYQVLGDRRLTLTGVYDAVNNWTTWSLPYPEAGEMYTVLTGSVAGQGKPGSLLRTTRPTEWTIRTTGDASAVPCIVGRKYTMRYRLSEQFSRDQQNVAVTGGKLKLRRMRVTYTDSGYFRAEVTPHSRETYSYPFTGKVLGAASLVIGKTSIESGVYSFPILTDSRGVTIDFVNDSHLPSTFQSAEFDAEFTIKAQRR